MFPIIVLTYAAISGALDSIRARAVIYFQNQILKGFVRARVLTKTGQAADITGPCRCVALVDDWLGPDAEEYEVTHLRLLRPGELIGSFFGHGSEAEQSFQQLFDAGVYNFICLDTKLLFSLDHERIEHPRLHKLSVQPFASG